MTPGKAWWILSTTVASSLRGADLVEEDFEEGRQQLIVQEDQDLY